MHKYHSSLLSALALAGIPVAKFTPLEKNKSSVRARARDLRSFDESEALKNSAALKRTRKNKKRLNDFASCHYSNPAKPASGLINRSWIANA